MSFGGGKSSQHGQPDSAFSAAVDTISNVDRPPGLMDMFINSTDTLRHRTINQKIPPTWNDKPPLFEVNVQSRSRPYLWRKPSMDHLTETEDPNLLKGMIRKGIPPPLRCAVWMSNVIQSSHSDQDLAVAHEYRTLAKVGVIDGLYDSLWVDNNSNSDGRTIRHNSLRRDDVVRLDLGNDTIWEEIDSYEEGNVRGCPGSQAMERVLYALHKTVLGGVVDFAPLVPTLASILLGFMSESYAFYALREFFHHSTWFWAASRPEHVAYKRAFCDVLRKLHPSTAAVMAEQDQAEPYCEAIFRDFFTSIWPESLCLRLMDIYTLEGSKVLFRFGVALSVLYGKEYKEKYMYTSTDINKWWIGLRDYCHNHLNFEVLVKKAYGLHGKGVRKRFRFPRRPILARLIEIEEESYRIEQQQLVEEGGGGGEGGLSGPSSAETDFYLRAEPLGLVIPPPPTDPDMEPVVPRLAASTIVRTKLAEWLPLSLRFTKLDLVYSTSHHGRTLESLYRCVGKSTHTIMLLEPFEDYGGYAEKIIIGMYASQPWRPSSRVYGDGRCFLFRIVQVEPTNGKEGKNANAEAAANKSVGTLESCVWKWRPPDLLEMGLSDTVSNDQDDPSLSLSSERQSSSNAALLETFQISTKDFLSMGGNHQGGAGLRLNEDLTKCESTTAAGFDNEPLLPAGKGMFEVGLVEVYQLVRQMDGIPVR